MLDALKPLTTNSPKASKEGFWTFWAPISLENGCQLKYGDLLSQIDKVERQIAAEVPTQESRAKVAGNMRHCTPENRWCDFHKTTSHNIEDCRSKKYHNSGPHGSAPGPVSSGAKPLVNKVKGSKVNKAVPRKGSNKKSNNLGLDY
ncbi:hypothetical protein HDU84_000787, partial [Entophlyctis sp. JEL0112]